MNSSYLLENEFLLELSDLTSRQNVLSEQDIERIAIDYTHNKAKNNPQLLSRSMKRAYELVNELGYEMVSEGKFAPSKD